ncbi:hypothetical protein FGL98_20805 [Leekyejoonella antrihumi]|uniref:Uncharacterized protein n=1 Tax=Leekyejoonella antrihumi TaxID=1660198 RepID=A0A563DV71_9MICO|nr:hypothetical protein FGL98_20805 [Leekyejoonella antrihumi]
MADASGAVLIDNHLINDPVFTAIGANGRDPLPGLAFKLAGRIGEIVREAVLCAPNDLDHIFTNWLSDTERDAELYRQIRDLAQARDARFVPVWLTCQRIELTRRVALSDRQERNKLRDPATLIEALDRNATLPPPTDALLLDTTDTSPTESARRILTFAGQNSRLGQP